MEEEGYMSPMRFVLVLTVIVIVIFWVAIAGVSVYLLSLIIRALRKYINSKDVREEKMVVRKSLGELLKENRLRCKMTQEFVAETLGVSRQAVSKWENGSSKCLYRFGKVENIKCHNIEISSGCVHASGSYSSDVCI